MNNIEEKYLEKAAENLEIRKVKKNEYFIHEGEPTGFFAGVIKGKVSIRKTHIFDKTTNQIVIKPLFKIITSKEKNIIRNKRRKSSNFLPRNNSNNNLNNNLINVINNVDQNTSKKSSLKKNKKNSKTPIKTYKRMATSKVSFNTFEERNNYRIVKEVFEPDKYIISEEELFRQGEGYCFGEWALIYRQPRSASIYTLEDCVFFILDEIYFKNSFLKSLNNSESIKKKFALQNFLPFDMMDDRQLSIYKNIIPITCKENQIIFNEGEVSDSIYLIYLGSFILEKKFRTKQFRVLNLEKGSIVGLESIFEGENSKYKCSLKLSRGYDIGLIFKLKINKLRPYILNKMKIAFRKNYNIFLKSWNELFCKNIFIYQKLLNENDEEIIKDKSINEYINYISENHELIEFNGDLFNKNWNSVLNIEQEDKYEVLIKDCLKEKLYDNYKKDGTLKIFSSKQKNKSFYYFNKIHIPKINYFKEKNFQFCEKINLFKNKNNININDCPKSDRNYKSLKAYKNNSNLTDIKKNNSNIEENEDTTNKISFNVEELLLKNTSQIKSAKKYFLNKSIPLKVAKKLLFEKDFKEDINSDENKYKTIYLKNDKIDNIKNESKGYNYQNKNILKNKRYSNIKEFILNKDILKKNNSFIENRKNIFNEKTNIFIKNYKNKLNNNNNNKNPMRINLQRKLFKIPLISGRELRKKILSHEKENSKSNINLLKDNSLKQKNMSLLNVKDTNLLDYFNKNNNNNSLNSKTAKNKRNIFDKKRMFKFIKNNDFTNRNSYLKNITIKENTKNYQELNLKNGFSISYFERKTSINNKSKDFSSESNLFKVSFDSGIFKIPLVSSSVKLEKI